MLRRLKDEKDNNNFYNGILFFSGVIVKAETPLDIYPQEMGSVLWDVIPTFTGDDYTKLRKINRHIIDTYDYDYGYSNYSAWRGYLTGKMTCSGYAEMFMYNCIKTVSLANASTQKRMLGISSNFGENGITLILLGTTLPGTKGELAKNTFLEERILSIKKKNIFVLIVKNLFRRKTIERR